MAGHIYSFSPTLNLTLVYSGRDHPHKKFKKIILLLKAFLRSNWLIIEETICVECTFIFIYCLPRNTELWIKKKKDLSIEDSFG